MSLWENGLKIGEQGYRELLMPGKVTEMKDADVGQGLLGVLPIGLVAHHSRGLLLKHV